MSTQKLQNLVWQRTHRDFRGNTENGRAVLVNMGARGTCLAPLHTLTAFELLKLIAPTFWQHVALYDGEVSPEASFATLYKKVEEEIGPSTAGFHERMCGVYRTIVQDHVDKLSVDELRILLNSIKSHIAAEAGLSSKPFTITFHKVEDANS